MKVGLVVWNGLMALWFVSWFWQVSENDCAASQFTEACETGRGAGITIGFTILVFIALAGNAILGVFWMVARPSSRPCPVCGHAVATGLTVCDRCGHDFRAAATVGGGRWEADPLGRHEFRYWDGDAWTDDVSDDGVVAFDPIG